MADMLVESGIHLPPVISEEFSQTVCDWDGWDMWGPRCFESSRALQNSQRVLHNIFKWSLIESLRISKKFRGNSCKTGVHLCHFSWMTCWFLPCMLVSSFHVSCYLISISKVAYTQHLSIKQGNVAKGFWQESSLFVRASNQKKEQHSIGSASFFALSKSLSFLLVYLL